MRILPNRTNSLFGNIPEIYRKKVMKWQTRKIYKDSKFLVIDDKDGHLGMCPLRINIPIDAYEPNKTYLYGGKTEIPINIPDTDKFMYIERNILGFKDRINHELLDTKYNLYNKNYYETKNDSLYEYVSVCRSLDRKENEKFDMDYKINKIKSNVAKNGYIYLEYYLALEDNNYEKYPSNRYLRYGEILKYFPEDEWTILTNEVEIVKDEYTPINRNNENVAIGYLDVRRMPTPKKKPDKKIYTNYNDECKQVKHAYTINGVVR